MKTPFGKRIVIGLAAVVMLAAIGVARAQADDHDGCSDATLRGDYGFRISGEILGPPVTLIDGVAMTHFDGKGNLTQVDFVMANGVPIPGPTDPTTGFRIDETGTYHVNPDCTGYAEFHFPPPPGLTGQVFNLMFVLSDHGRKIHTVVSQLILPGSSVSTPQSIVSDAEKLGDIRNDDKD